MTNVIKKNEEEECYSLNMLLFQYNFIISYYPDTEPSPSVPTLLPGPCPLAVVRVGSAVAVLDLCESRPPEVRTVLRPEGRVLSVSGNTLFAVNADSNAGKCTLGHP